MKEILLFPSWTLQDLSQRVLWAALLSPSFPGIQTSLSFCHADKSRPLCPPTQKPKFSFLQPLGTSGREGIGWGKFNPENQEGLWTIRGLCCCSSLGTAAALQPSAASRSFSKRGSSFQPHPHKPCLGHTGTSCSLFGDAKELLRVWGLGTTPRPCFLCLVC